MIEKNATQNERKEKGVGKQQEQRGMEYAIVPAGEPLELFFVSQRQMFQLCEDTRPDCCVYVL